MRTEDQVRDEAKDILNFNDDEDALCGVGQITTFNQLGFKGISDKPDGWYLPKDTSKVAIILETKSEKLDVETEKFVDEIKKNCNIAMGKYREVVGILYNGKKTKVFLNNKPMAAPEELQEKNFYINRVKEKAIDKQMIYKLTARINSCLHFDFGIKNLYHRMIFTACALVAERFNSKALMEGMDYQTFHTSIHSTLSKSLENSKKQNQKLEILLQVYSEIKLNSTENQQAIDKFILWVKEISKTVNSNHWRGEDVMGIFFNEFNRYKKKSESGQIFTPDHITSFVYRVIGCSKQDNILDAACGSGAFLVKAMSKMIEESGGVDTKKAKEIKEKSLYGIEFDREIYALACANMLIHKDGKTNLEHLDTRTEKAVEWMKDKNITKVLMNPPYENKYGCIDIIKNTLDAVTKDGERRGIKCAFILPDKKLEKASKKKVESILESHRLVKIIKLPENLFFGIGVTTSVFIFEAGIPQEEREIFACYMKEDGLETVKNQGRQDIRDKWRDIEDYWVEATYKMKDSKYKTDQWIKPSEHLSYQVPQKPFEIFEEDFRKTAMDYLMFQEGINSKEFSDKLLEATMYSSEVTTDKDAVNIILEKGGDTYGED